MGNYQLRDYQAADVQFAIEHGSVINANPPGLGKTLETLATIDKLPFGRVLIISPKIATGVWKYEAKKWLDWDCMRITGEFKPEERKNMREAFIRENKRVLIINANMMEEIQEWQDTWDYIVVDEVHLLGLLNYKSQAFDTLSHFNYGKIFLLTGTPVRKGPQDLWTLLNLVNARKFPSYWAFVNRHCWVMQTKFGKEILSRPKKPVEFNKMIYQYMIRRKKSDVLTELPDKQRSVVPIEMVESEQKKVYEALLEDMYAEIPNQDELLVVQSKMTLVLRLQQLLVCPMILGIQEYGVALKALVTYWIPQTFEEKRAIVIATPFRTAIPFIEEAIRTEYPHIPIEVIHGKIKETAQEVAERFQQYETYKKILIYTIKSGASWTAHTASAGFMLGYDWSAINNLQAEDRIHRLGQLQQVTWQYILHENTVDDTVMHRLDEKADAMGWTLDTAEFTRKLEEQRQINLRKRG